MLASRSIAVLGCLVSLSLTACESNDAPAPTAPPSSPATAADPSASPSLGVPEDRLTDDTTTRAEALEALDDDGPPGAPVTWRVDPDVPSDAAETVQHSYAMVELGWARGSTPRPDLASGLFQPGNDAGLAIVQARGYLIDGDPVESQILNYFLDDVMDSDGSRVQKIVKLNAGSALSDSPRADDRRCAQCLDG
ncbi:hypothetical protein ACHAAC_16635 [Aeromicrobium sp. CF4.19]|uniref:hypothetical protein n=1 Tax=Aeromicrobium sp. CF4.19 TaxID=3373082 RepID=UPI003EE6E364